MKVYLNKEYKCVKVEDNTFVANDSSNYIRYYFVTNANGDVIDKMDDTSVIYRNTEPSYVTVAFRRADGNVIQHLMASPKTDVTGNSFFEYEITDTDGVLYKKGALEISAQFIEATLSEAGGVKKVISQKVKAIAINTAHVLDNIGEEAEEYYSQYEQANNDAHAVLQTQITTNFNNIGTLQELTTDAKDDLVKAINEVDAHADANKSEIGDLSALTTDEKTTIVGAINEVDAHADANKAEIGNLSALTTDEKATLVGAIDEVDNHADNATTLANNAVATANGAVATANEAKTTAQTAENNANSAVDKADNAIDRANKAYEKAANNVYAVGFMTLQEAITAVNGYDNTVLKTNDNILVVAQGSPDLYVTSVEATNIPYNFTTVDKFNDDLVKNTVLQIGYYKVAFYETDGQPVTVAYQNVVVKSTDWVASTEFADFPYEAKIPLSNFVDYKTVPQVVFDIADTMSGNYAPICKSGDKCVYIYGKVQNEITLKTVITFAPNVNGASVVGGGYNNRGKWVASTTYAIDDLVYTDNGQYVCIEGITSTTSPEQDSTHWQATFVATGRTKNTLTISGQDNGTGVQKTFDGSTAVEIAFDENTMTAKEVDGVLKVGAKGTIPEALPQEASALKSGNLPITGWTNISAPVWTGAQGNTAYNDSRPVFNLGVTWESVSAMPLNGWTFSWHTSSDPGYIRKETGSWEKTNSYIYKSIDYEHFVLLIYPNGDVYFKSQNSSYGANQIILTEITQTTLSKQGYTISDTSITANSDILMELTDDGGVKAYSMEAGKITVIRDTVPTQPIPYTYKVKQTNASGQFTVLNHYMARALPQEASALKSGKMTTSGWAATENKELYNGKLSFAGYNYAPSNNGKILSPYDYTSKNALRDWSGTIIDGKSIENCTIKTDSGGVNYVSLYWESGTPSHVSREIQIYNDGTVKAWTYASNSTTYDVTIVATFLSDYAYTISDADVTTNSDILMEIADVNHIVSAPIESGKIKVISNAIPTQPIPYTYKVKQTNASGQFTVLNHYVAGVTSVNGQTGAVTIDVPTKTSELENDSGYVSNLPIVRNVVCNDVDSVATLDTTITCEVGDLILAQIIVRSALTLPTGWTLLRTIPAVDPPTNQTLSFAYKRATSTSETLTVTQATAGRIYTNLVRLSNAASISYIQSCEKTGTGIKSISSTKPVTPNMVIWGAASSTWSTNSPSGDWTYSPSTLDYYSLPQVSRQPRLGTFVDSSGAGERTFTGTIDSSTSMMCGAVEIVGDEVARKGDIPTSLPVSYKKASGELPTSEWTATVLPLWEGTVNVQGSYKGVVILPPNSLNFNKLKQYTTKSDWQIWTNKSSTYEAPVLVSVSSSEIMIGGNDKSFKIKSDGSLYGYNGSSSDIVYKGLKCLAISQYTFPISDTSITANTSVKMYLTDAGGVKAYSKAVGSIQVIRDTVPTTAIPYEYEVEQTSAEGLFEVINAYVPTKTSQLTNDSGFITAADIPSAGEWVDVAGETATLTQAGTYQVIASVNDMQSIVYWDGSTAAYGTKSTAPSVSTSGGTAYLFINCAYPQIDASGTLSVHLLTAGNSSGAWTETDTVQSGFKYRKIN